MKYRVKQQEIITTLLIEHGQFTSGIKDIYDIELAIRDESLEDDEIIKSAKETDEGWIVVISKIDPKTYLVEL